MSTIDIIKERLSNIPNVKILTLRSEEGSKITAENSIEIVPEIVGLFVTITD